MVYYLWLVVPFYEKVQFKTTGSRNAGPFLWGDGAKKEHRQWTGPKRKPADDLEAREAQQQTQEQTETREVQEQIETQETEEAQEEAEDQPSKQLLAQRQARAWISKRIHRIMQESSM